MSATEPLNRDFGVMGDILRAWAQKQGATSA